MNETLASAMKKPLPEQTLKLPTRHSARKDDIRPTMVDWPMEPDLLGLLDLAIKINANELGNEAVFPTNGIRN